MDLCVALVLDLVTMNGGINGLLICTALLVVSLGAVWCFEIEVYECGCTSPGCKNRLKSEVNSSFIWQNFAYADEHDGSIGNGSVR